MGSLESSLESSDLSPLERSNARRNHIMTRRRNQTKPQLHPWIRPGDDSHQLRSPQLNQRPDPKSQKLNQRLDPQSREKPAGEPTSEHLEEPEDPIIGYTETGEPLVPLPPEIESQFKLLKMQCVHCGQARLKTEFYRGAVKGGVGRCEKLQMYTIGLHKQAVCKTCWKQETTRGDLPGDHKTTRGDLRNQKPTTDTRK